MKFRKNSIFRKISATFLILLGILGIFLPILPGFIFFFAGFSLISKPFAKDMRKSNSRYRCHKDVFKFLRDIWYSAIRMAKNSLK